MPEQPGQNAVPIGLGGDSQNLFFDKKILIKRSGFFTKKRVAFDLLEPCILHNINKTERELRS
ncbi:hypothetical protein HMPREF0495_01058 [Levilactobacillus brevis ATCC 14869 = DSM 20054]|uniref:Uncharacterized protein n=1 Tax=Levilactobacillus brevis ATCC 14869 = DSM 20054 TaxID=649758 RepID=U2QSF7_LEVBR|nr:hypothetical protein HMPREF0495_01058 [Levilactobacillus brevis ATCC 14869 = DSM 20054]MCT3572466.1 hypothetical protein [Levilactobacillus brevis]